jgi:hypothetical protein
MHAGTVKRILEEGMKRGDRIAIGFADRSFFIEAIQSIEVTELEDEGKCNQLYKIVAMLYDTSHSRQPTPEEAYFESNDVISLARPAIAP